MHRSARARIGKRCHKIDARRLNEYPRPPRKDNTATTKAPENWFLLIRGHGLIGTPQASSGEGIFFTKEKISWSFEKKEIEFRARRNLIA